jgi:hypothetical protein
MEYVERRLNKYLIPAIFSWWIFGVVGNNNVICCGFSLDIKKEFFFFVFTFGDI